MKKIDRLKKEALMACQWTGHKMGKWTNLTYGEGWRNPGPRYTASAECQECGMLVDVDTRPPANGIEIGGEAVALFCKRFPLQRKVPEYIKD